MEYGEGVVVENFLLLFYIKKLLNNDLLEIFIIRYFIYYFLR
jgi:hypothetical protein